MKEEEPNEEKEMAHYRPRTLPNAQAISQGHGFRNNCQGTTPCIVSEQTPVQLQTSEQLQTKQKKVQSRKQQRKQRKEQWKALEELRKNHPELFQAVHNQSKGALMLVPTEHGLGLVATKQLPAGTVLSFPTTKPGNADETIQRAQREKWFMTLHPVRPGATISEHDLKELEKVMMQLRETYPDLPADELSQLVTLKAVHDFNCYLTGTQSVLSQVGSFLNHSDECNSRWVVCGERLIVMTDVDVAAGSEVTIHYRERNTASTHTYTGPPPPMSDEVRERWEKLLARKASKGGCRLQRCDHAA